MWRWCLRTVQNAGGYAVDIATSPRPYLFATSSFWIRLYGTNSKSSQTYDGPLLSVYNGARRGPLNQAMEMETQRAWQETSYRPAMRTRAVSEHPGALTHLLTDRTLRYGGGRRPEPHGVTPAPSSEERLHNDVLDAGRRAGPSSNASSADRLRELLFHANHTVKSDEPFGINRIRNLYLSANTRGQLPSFKPGDFQALVCLVGSLSVSTSRRPYVSVYSHPLVTRMSAHSLRPHWGLLRRIVKDKSSLGYRLNVSDHYWLMRAHIAELQTADSGKWAHLHSACHHYNCIRWQVHPDVHVHYLEALLVNGNEEFIEMAICKACDLLLWYHDCPPQLLAVFWKVLLPTDQDIRPEMKRNILQVVQRRLCRRLSIQASLSSHSPTSSRPADSTRSASQASVVEVLITSLERALFTRSKSSTSPLLDWAQSVLCPLFPPTSDDGSLRTQWTYLILLALARGLSPSSPNLGVPTAQLDTPRMAAADWQAVCVLATLGRTIGSGSDMRTASLSDEAVHEVSRILNTLWSNWISAVREVERHSHPVAAVAISAEFFRLAGYLRNRGLCQDIAQFCTSYMLWSGHLEGDDSDTRPAVLRLAQEFLTSSLRCRVPTDLALSTVMDNISDPTLLSEVVSTTLSSWSHIDAKAAHALRLLAFQLNIGVTSESLTDLNDALAEEGFVKLALDSLSEGHFTPKQHLRILTSILSVLVRGGHHFRKAFFSPAVGDAMLKQFTFKPPPHALRSTLQNVLPLMPRFGQSSTAVAVLKSVTITRPGYFSGRAFVLLLEALLRHRQFRLAVTVYELAIKSRQLDSPSSGRALILHLSRVGARSLALKLAQSVETQSAAVSFARKLRYQEASPVPMLTCRVPRFLERHVKPRHLVHRAVGVLIRARRMRAAKRMYERLRDAQSESSRTAIGNHILYSSLLAKSRRNARRVRKGLDTLNQLTNKFGFVPDRVTVNVLLVGLMRWTSVVDREKLRVLFDHMVRSGYPTGGLHFRSVVPFGTAAPTTQMLNIPEVHSSLSYAKHVRPLYKMFIKAFHRRGDKVAVGVVIKILKAVEAEAVDQSEQRELARAEGIRRKSARNSRR